MKVRIHGISKYNRTIKDVCNLLIKFNNYNDLQVTVMIVTILAIAIYGTMDTGGAAHVWQKAEESGRAELMNLDPSPTTRHSFWTLVIGGYFTWITIYGCNQAQVKV